MKLILKVNELDTEASHKLDLVKKTSTLLFNYFLNQSFGEDIKEFLFICILVKTKPGFEEWFKARKPKYIEYKTYKNKITKETIEIKNQFTIEFKIDDKEYDDFIALSDEESKKILAKKILESLANLDKLPKKAKDFDKEKFKANMEVFFKEQKLI